MLPLRSADTHPELVKVGALFRTARRAAGATQQSAGAAAGVSQSAVSLFERGRLPGITVPTLMALCRGLDVELRLVARPPLAVGRLDQRDPVHAWCCAYVRTRLARAGWLVAGEVGFRDGTARGWIDVLAFDPLARTLLVVEVKSELRDIGDLERQVGWYAGVARRVARDRGWQAAVVRAVVLLLASSSNDLATAANRAMLDVAFPVRARLLDRLLARERVGDPAATNPGVLAIGWGLAMIDPRSRTRRWLLGLKADGRRRSAPYRDYADCLRSRQKGRSPVSRPCPRVGHEQHSSPGSTRARAVVQTRAFRRSDARCSPLP